MPLPLVSVWLGLGVRGQLSGPARMGPPPSGSRLPSERLSLSVSGSRGSVPTVASLVSMRPSLSSSGSQTFPMESPSVFSWFAFALLGQLSLVREQPEGPPLAAPGLQTPSASGSTCSSEQPAGLTSWPPGVLAQRSGVFGIESPSASASQEALGPTRTSPLKGPMEGVGWKPAGRRGVPGGGMAGGG